jgi:signal recognition particle subunit SRP54
MMFADLSSKLGAAFKKLKGEARITEKNIAHAVKDVRMAFLEADVNYRVAKDFLSRVEERTMGRDVILSVSPAQQFIKVVNDELVRILGGIDYSPKIRLSSEPPTVILMTGLQGSGKTTSCGKLARHFIKDGKNVLLVACDVYRPAAIRQLEVVADQSKSAIYADTSTKEPIKIASDSIACAKKLASVLS